MLNKISIIQLFLLFIYLNKSIAYSQPCATCTLNGWQYEQDITIDNAAIATSYTPFQELLIIDTQTPISLGQMQASGDDIRFLDSACNMQLCYWIESGINTTTTQIWVLLPTLAANSILTIHMFYGNTSAVVVSNFNCVFPNVLTVTGVVTLSGNQNYDWIDIQPGSTVDIGAASILAFKARKIIMAGTINGNGAGYGPASGYGAGVSGGGAVGGGGGGYGGTGGSGACPGGQAGASYGTANGADIDMGSGAGGSDCGATAAGGGAVSFEGAVVDMSGNISVNGNSGVYCCCGNGSEAAGGGAGGGIYIKADYVNGNGTLSAIGGNGGGSDAKEGGGGGAGGRIKLFYCKVNNFTGVTNASKGLPGAGGQCSANDAQNGTSTVNTFLCETITMGPVQFSVMATTSPVSICVGQNATLLGSGGLSYSWLPGGQTTSSIVVNPPASASYTLTVSDANGCTDDTTVTVTVNALPTVNAGADVSICIGDSALLTATATSNLWLWSPSGNLSNAAISNPVATPSSSTTYTITVTDANGCSNMDSILITVNPLPTASAGSPINICFGFNTTLNASGGSSYSWSPSSGLSNPNISNPIANPTSTTTYTVSVTGANGCSDTDTMSITVNPLPIVNTSSQTNSSCFGGSNGSASVTVTAGNIPYAYLWNNAQTTSTSTGLSAGNYSVTIIDVNGCTTSQTVTITQPTALSVSTFQSNVSCNGMSNGSLFTNVSGGTPGFSYSWSNGQTVATATGLSAGNYYVTIIDANGCTIAVSANIIQPAVLSSNISSVNATCGNNDGTALSSVTGGSGNYSYSWNTSPAQTSPNVTGLIPGTIYTLTITDTNGCMMTDTISVGQDPPPIANVSGTTVICIGDNAVLTASGGLNYLWSNGITNSSITVNPASTANYTVTAINGNCFDTATITVTVNLLPIAGASTDTTIMQFQSVTLSGSGGISYQWVPPTDLSCSNCQNPTSLPMTTTTYIVTVTDTNGCTSTDTVIVFVTPIECADPYLPNAFSPNGDGENDVLKVYNKVPECIKDLRLVIYNRYGEKIFETYDPAFEWNGVYNRGILAKTDEAGTEVFVYYLKATVFPDTKIKKKGNISLVR